ncbi:MAG: protoglobin domain-containing protein [Archaeoglobaceae archaeon]
METAEEQKIHFRWSKEDEENLRELKDFGEKYKDEFTEEIYSYLANFSDFEKYLPTEDIREKHQEKLKQWFVSLFSGDYSPGYLRRLYRIGEAHVKSGLPPHYVNTTMNFKREFIREKLIQEYGYTEELERLMKSVDKIIDLNLDIMTSSYREEELKYYLARGKFQRNLIENIRKVSQVFEIFIVVALIAAGVFLIFSIIYETYIVFTGQLRLDQGIFSILGLILILYAIYELLGEEIRHIRGAVLSIKAFISLALAAVIRKVLLLSLTPEKVYEIIAIGFLLLVLGAVYWIIYKAEKETRTRYNRS